MLFKVLTIWTTVQFRCEERRVDLMYCALHVLIKRSFVDFQKTLINENAICIKYSFHEKKKITQGTYKDPYLKEGIF